MIFLMRKIENTFSFFQLFLDLFTYYLKFVNLFGAHLDGYLIYGIYLVIKFFLVMLF
ncbi:hypothetical protein GLOIN_2v1552937 [Rhizophagus irregularis DAOM 181602=DAOM 197198]|uniref:Uncharacterized protein n=1 Tax=Rhizophagus irregularis (strain DAOM 181602 / DAOM 197198 / MUCL 43194) TaxID=747089 RepID=A0A2P4QGT9_RHIID|nr:hypothetical protein GLOIN_2v1552937 [Rhizophagus irregularis DAOM 181602=DAOM 197198]POG76854.1 hypothetical protein GLOIN_2v1552937 [Rhizophagus irregularis DAOM 181602=DAOM 197198]|eukprot:XP_025183720.1 hypothetical protein GLOIN_2v1552937 [Rhizophagus irregularis DAOM 181602=DAOM 197198]